MFTGIIEELGWVSQIKPQGDGKEFTIQCSSSFLKLVKIGDSIAVNGACQTVTALGNQNFSFFSSKQTLEITNLSNLTLKDRVNLEKALMMGSRLDGHLVSGHIDTVGQVWEIKKQQAGVLLEIKLPSTLLPLVIPKGSIAIDGISLTIYKIKDSIISFSVIPHTFEHTTLKFYNKGSLVNLEADFLGKYVQRALQFKDYEKQNSYSSPNLEKTLKEQGFWL